MTEKATTTAVVVNWRRPWNIPWIVESLLAQPFVAEVIVWDNSGELELPADDKVHVIRSTENVKLWGRFRAAEHARHPWIMTQDDDYIVRNWAELWEAAQANTEAITANMHLGENGGDQIPCGDGWDIMLGWGSVFRAELAKRVFTLYVDRYGIDDVLMRDADRFFAVIQGRKHVALRASVEPLPGVSGPMAMHLEPMHSRSTKEARRRAALMVEQRNFAEYCMAVAVRHEDRLASLVGQIELQGGQILPSEMMVFAALCLDQEVETVIESGRSDGYSTEFLCRLADWRVVSFETHPHQARDAELVATYRHLQLNTGDGIRRVPEIVGRCARPAVLLDGPKSYVGLDAWSKVVGRTAVGGVHDLSRKTGSEPNTGRLQAEELPVFFTDDKRFLDRFGQYDAAYMKRNGYGSHGDFLYETAVLGVFKGGIFRMP